MNRSLSLPALFCFQLLLISAELGIPLVQTSLCSVPCRIGTPETQNNAAGSKNHNNNLIRTFCPEVYIFVFRERVYLNARLKVSYQVYIKITLTEPKYGSVSQQFIVPMKENESSSIKAHRTKSVFSQQQEVGQGRLKMCFEKNTG